MTTSLVLLSGGMDSAVALAAAVDPRLAVSVDYGQRHVRELRAAEALAAHYSVEHIVLDMTGWGKLLKGSSLTDSSVPVPEGDYDEPSMALTVVPNRNATMLNAAVGIAQAYGLSRVVTAVHSGDHHIYADCRPQFIDALNRSVAESTEGQVEVHAPFVRVTKTDIAILGAALRVPFELTWSCYVGGELHCGRCSTCRERRDAFRIAALPDPTEYAA